MRGSVETDEPDFPQPEELVGKDELDEDDEMEVTGDELVEESD